MQQRRPHSTVAIPDGSGATTTREQRRNERRIAKEKRNNYGTKKYRRVKRTRTTNNNNSKLYRIILGKWKNDPYLQITFFTFMLCTIFGISIYRMFHGGNSSNSHNLDAPAKHTPFQANRASNEYNSDNAGGSLLSKLRGELFVFFFAYWFDYCVGYQVCSHLMQLFSIATTHFQSLTYYTYSKGGLKYTIPESLKRIGNKKRWYADLRYEYDTEILPKDDERSLAFVEAERAKQGQYVQKLPQAQTPYDIHNCPEYPVEDYPIQWPVLDVLHNWPTDDHDADAHKEIYQGICIFDYNTEYEKADNYRHAEVPFVMRNDPQVARTTERWNSPGYMEKLLMGKEDQMRRTEYSPNNHFMYWVDKRTKEQRRAEQKDLKVKRKAGEDAHGGFGRGDQVEMKEAMGVLEELNDLKRQLQAAKDYAEDHEDDDEAQEEVKHLKHKLNEAKKKKNADGALQNWQPPTENMRMTYVDWLEHANVTDDQLGPDNPHYYFRLIGCGDMGENTADGSCDKGSSEWLFDELTFFQPRRGDERPFYIIEPKQQKGIHCRFGMKGVIAENHFDLSRNAITLLGGQRRYILSNPSECKNMNLLPRGHPSARHSAVDWSNPDLVNYPTFEKATVNEIVMQPGDVLYLPTNWFHYIVSLELNMQCNTRSGGERINREYVTECGF